MKSIWEPEFETMPRSALQKLQLERLQAKVRHLYEKVPFYRHAMRERGVSPDSLRSLGDLTRFPFTTKRDFRDNYPFGLLAVPLEQTARIQVSSGTTGKPIVAVYTAADLELWTGLMARTLTSGGVTRGDLVHIAFTYGLFTGGLGFHYGAERVGAGVIPASSGQSKRQVMLIEDLGSTVLCCTPSYSLLLAETAVEMGVDLREGSLRVGFFGAEPWSHRLRAEIEAKLGIMALDSYGLTEVLGPGVAAECTHKKGMHLYEDHFLAEIVDPATGDPLPEGSQGELVLTTLTKEGSPVLRLRTGDITALNSEPCPCGRTLARMEKVAGRTDDMLIVQGVSLFPSQIESLLLRFEGVEPHYQIVVDRRGGLDDLEIQVEVSLAIMSDLSDEVRRLESIERVLRTEIENVLGLSARVRLVEPGSLRRTEQKASRVVDRRHV